MGQDLPGISANECHLRPAQSLMSGRQCRLHLPPLCAGTARRALDFRDFLSHDLGVIGSLCARVLVPYLGKVMKRVRTAIPALGHHSACIRKELLSDLRP